METQANNLSYVALRLRENLIEMNRCAGTSHIGGCLSLVEIMVALYFEVMRVDPSNPTLPGRDRLVVSKAHASATWYSALAERGFFPRKRLFDSFISVGGMLQEHADMTKTPGVDMSAGSLGQGLSAACGMAWAARHVLNAPGIAVYVILGDGECQEGQVWEAAMSAAHKGLDNLVAIVDYNDMQVNGPVRSVMAVEPLAAKWQAFGWRAREVDGHDIPVLIDALISARDARQSCPQVIIAHTVKGKGISFMENNPHWHGGSLSESQYVQAKQELAQLADSLSRGEEQPDA